jgi:hypothetical protein
MLGMSYQESTYDYITSGFSANGADAITNRDPSFWYLNYGDPSASKSIQGEKTRTAKYSYFNKGKKLLEDAVKKEPNSIEIRMMRYISQEKTPKFLGYNENMKADKEFILKNYKNSDDENLVSFIKKYFKI